MKKVIRQDIDAIFIVDGEIEGTGKSVLAQQCALYCDPSFSIDRIVFSPWEFKRAVLDADKYQCVIWDEAYEGTSKFQIFSVVNQMIRSLLRQIRQKNLMIFIVIPSFTDLDHDIGVRRSWGLLRAKLDIDFENQSLLRGNFEFYSRKQKAWLYYIESNRMQYKKGLTCNSSFVGKFENVYGVNKQAYLEKKSNIKINSFIDDRTFIEECILRKMPWGLPIQLKNYANMSEQHYYRLKRGLVVQLETEDEEKEALMSNTN